MLIAWKKKSIKFLLQLLEFIRLYSQFLLKFGALDQLQTFNLFQFIYLFVTITSQQPSEKKENALSEPLYTVGLQQRKPLMEFNFLVLSMGW